MNTTDLIDWIIEHKGDITIASPEPGVKLVQVQHGLATGGKGCNALVRHQQVGNSVQDMLARIKKDMLYAEGMETKVIQLERKKI